MEVLGAPKDRVAHLLAHHGNTVRHELRSTRELGRVDFRSTLRPTALTTLFLEIDSSTERSKMTNVRAGWEAIVELLEDGDVHFSRAVILQSSDTACLRYRQRSEQTATIRLQNRLSYHALHAISTERVMICVNRYVRFGLCRWWKDLAIYHPSSAVLGNVYTLNCLSAPQDSLTSTDGKKMIIYILGIFVVFALALHSLSYH